MANLTRKQREAEACNAIRNLIDGCEGQTTLIKERWRQNYDMFAYGTCNDEKQLWQTKFSVPKLQNSIRTGAGKLVETIFSNPDWYEICPVSYYNAEAFTMASAFKKLMDYYLDKAHFKRHANNFFLCSLISSGNIDIGWHRMLIQNPDFILQKTEESRRKEAQRLAKSVANPDVATEMSMDGEDMEAKLLASIDDVMAEAQGQELEREEIKPYIEVGCLRLKDLNHERVYWDPNVQYMEDSVWRAFEEDVNMYELEQMADVGLLDRKAVDKVGSNQDIYTRDANYRLRYKNLQNKPGARPELVKITVYYGPLIVGNKIKKQNYFAVIANNSIILKDGDYPYWEPPGHHTAVVTAAVRQIPYRATGAGIGDSATELQKVYDSNWQLVCDTFRYGIGGINITNKSALVDKSQLDEGIYPGINLEARVEPDKVFKHIDFTNNIENQASPVQSMLESAIDQATGVNELMLGGGNQYSRTPASETNARLAAGQANINTIAIDLETNFLVPALQKCMARILQFGIPDIARNPELQSLLDEDEQRMLMQMNAGGRMRILNEWYKIKINGFSAAIDRDAEAQRDNEIMQIYNSGGPLQSLINGPELVKRYFKNRGVKDPERLLVVTNSPLELVTAENKLLMAGTMVAPNPAEDLEFHMQMHAPLAQSPQATPAMQQHFQETQMLLQQMQMQQQQAQAQQGQMEEPIQ